MFSENDLGDEWFFDSIKRYDDLQMFEFQGEVTATCFQCENNFLVTCKSVDSSYEVLQLAIPDRLIATEDAGLVKNRDFNVLSAAYLGSKANDIISYKQIIIISENDGVKIYNLPNEKVTDLIQHKTTVCISKSLICVHEEKETLYCASTLKDCQNYNLFASDKIKNTLVLPKPSESTDINLYRDKDLSFLGSFKDDLVFGLKDTGCCITVDQRSSKCRLLRVSEVNKNCIWSYSLSNENKICCLNSLGEVSLYDARNISDKLQHFTLPFKKQIQSSKLHIQLSPDETYLSVSGLDNTIKIFSLNGSEFCSIPAFEHDGHGTASVGSHLWHPLLSRLLFSHDNHGILQAWKFKCS